MAEKTYQTANAKAFLEAAKNVDSLGVPPEWKDTFVEAMKDFANYFEAHPDITMDVGALFQEKLYGNLKFKIDEERLAKQHAAGSYNQDENLITLEHKHNSSPRAALWDKQVLTHEFIHFLYMNTYPEPPLPKYANEAFTEILARQISECYFSSSYEDEVDFFKAMDSFQPIKEHDPDEYGINCVPFLNGEVPKYLKDIGLCDLENNKISKLGAILLDLVNNTLNAADNSSNKKFLEEYFAKKAFLSKDALIGLYSTYTTYTKNLPQNVFYLLNNIDIKYADLFPIPDDFRRNFDWYFRMNKYQKLEEVAGKPLLNTYEINNLFEPDVRELLLLFETDSKPLLLSSLEGFGYNHEKFVKFNSDNTDLSVETIKKFKATPMPTNADEYYNEMIKAAQKHKKLYQQVDENFKKWRKEPLTKEMLEIKLAQINLYHQYNEKFLLEENDNKSNELYVCDGKYTDYGMLYHDFDERKKIDNFELDINLAPGDTNIILLPYTKKYGNLNENDIANFTRLEDGCYSLYFDNDFFLTPPSNNEEKNKEYFAELFELERQYIALEKITPTNKKDTNSPSTPPLPRDERLVM